MGKDNTIKITEEEALELLRKRLLHLRETTDFFSAVFRTMGGYAIIAADLDGTIQAYNEEVIKLYGYTHEEIVGNKMNIEVFYPTDFIETEKLSGTIKDTMIHGTCSFKSEQIRKDGSRFPAHIVLVVVKSNEGKIVGFVKIVQDISERKYASEENRKLSAAVEQSVNIIFITDTQGRIEYVNPTFERVTGYSGAEVLGKTPRILDSGETAEIVLDEMLKTITAGKTWRGTVKNKKKDGHYYWCESLTTPICDEKGQIIQFLTMQEDITEKMELKENVNLLSSYASFDGLTGLYNRTRFIELLEDWLILAKTHCHTGAILLIDIDKFRLVNNIYGSKFGDDLLKFIAEHLKNIMDGIDMQYFSTSDREIMESILCRMGGDEFAVFLPSRNEEESLATAEEIRRRLESLQFGELTSHITVSIGIVLYPSHGSTLYDLFKKVDAAIFSAKESGRNRSRLYRPEDLVLEKMHSRVVWKERIQKAVNENRVEPWFQPILNLKENVIDHYEVLARIRNEDGSIAMPGEFIDTAEAFGLIMDIDKIILEKALKFQEKLLKDGRHFHFSINLSAKDLEDKVFIDFLKNKLSEVQKDAECPVFEITETAAIHDLGRVVKFINELKSIGCKLSLDDFGVGFTSFRYLKEMDVDYIKIDGSFIRMLAESKHDRLFVKSMVDVAQGMGIKTVAEFVENGPTIKILRELGVDYAQGYFIGKPAPTILDR